MAQIKIAVCECGRVVWREDLASRRGARRPGPALCNHLEETYRQMKIVRLPP